MTVTVTMRHVNVAIANVRGMGWKTREIQGKAIMAAGEVLKVAVEQHLSITTHTLKDLERMDHPYARRHGSIQIYPQRPFLVHSHSRKMRNAVTLQEVHDIDRGMVAIRARVGLDYGRQRYFKYVIQGTKVMLPRDTLYQVSQLRGVRKGMMRAVVKKMGEELRTKATIRF